MDRTQFTVPQCVYSTAVHILPLLAVLNQDIIIACTVHLYIYTPKVRTGFKEPRCL